MAEQVSCSACGRVVLADAPKPRRVDALGQVTGIAQDLGNVLTVVTCSADLIRQQIDQSHEFFPDVQAILSAAERGAGLKAQLITLARRQKPAVERVDLNDVVRDVVSNGSCMIEERITVVQRLDPAGAMVLANRSQLEQMVTQLLLNARDAIRDGFGSIVISTSQGTSSVLLRVADSGVGMTKEVQRRIFEPFFTTHRDIGRAGLGLATVRTAINNAGGSINVESTVGVGSAFEIWLPRIES